VSIAVKITTPQLILPKFPFWILVGP
jgi:hypothetical protein